MKKNGRLKWSKIFILVILGLTFFRFVDNKYQGWEDTNQYQLEAQAWAKGSRPPVMMMLQDPQSHVGPSHVPPLTPYIWSKLINTQSDYRSSLFHIKIFQAALLLVCFVMFGYLVGIPFALVFFFNDFFRELVFIPISEPLAITLLIGSYAFPPLSGIAAGLMCFVRPPLVVLFLPLLWRHRKNWMVWVGGMSSTLIGILYFHPLEKPSSFQGMGFNFNKSLDIFVDFNRQLYMQLFKHVLPLQSQILHVIFGIALMFAAARVLKKGVKKPSFLIPALTYLWVIQLPFAQGVRYFVPLLFFIFLEIKPSLSKKKVVLFLVTIVCVHLVFQQLESLREFKRFSIPETDSPDMASVRNWIKGNGFENETLLMGKFRYCVNYFQTTCYGSALDFNNLNGDLRKKRISFIILPRIAWQTEEKTFEENLRRRMGEQFQKRAKEFGRVIVVDVRGL